MKNLTAEQAYPHMPSWDLRERQVIKVGTKVTVGPAIGKDGLYHADGLEGPAKVTFCSVEFDQLYEVRRSTGNAYRIYVTRLQPRY